VVALFLAAQAPKQLVNGSFYQAAASLLGVLLLTNAITEVRATRGNDHQSDRWIRRSIAGFLALSVIVLVGELAALTVLIRQTTTPLLQFVVGAALILGLTGVPGLVFLGVVRELVGSESVTRWVRMAAISTAAVAIGVVGGFALPPLFTGKPGVGTPTPVTTESSEATPPPAEQCPSTAPTGAPPAILEEFERLQLRVGKETAGCPVALHTRSSPRVFWTLGIDPGTGHLLSLGIAGQAPAALLIAPAAKIGVQLLRDGELLGASKRLPAGRGDLYLLYTKSGTAVLLRSSVGNAEKGQPYLLLPPPVAAAWLGAVRETRMLLWVTIVPSRESGLVVYRLASAYGSGDTFMVRYKPSSREAFRGPYVYRSPSPELNVRELEPLLSADCC
jgi:hypothetical protein